MEKNASAEPAIEKPLASALSTSSALKRALPPNSGPHTDERSAGSAQEAPDATRGNADSGSDAPASGRERIDAGGGGEERSGENGGGEENDGPQVRSGTHVNPWPAYPELARQRGQEGHVVLCVHVDRDGNPARVLLDVSSGHSLLDQAAMEAIRRWSFTPASRNGEAVPSTVKVPVTFQLQ